ncbi:MAG: hypothetical protein GVY30_11855, partial [Chloroflexi bacterium]|nr:hypothetical protein [Chloroflexota bacterium]
MAGGVVDIIEDVVSVVVPPGESVEFMVRVVVQSVVDHPNWWDVDLRDKLMRRENCPPPLGNGWWRRSLDQI